MSKFTELGPELNSKGHFFNYYFIAFHGSKKKVTRTHEANLSCVGRRRHAVETVGQCFESLVWRLAAARSIFGCLCDHGSVFHFS